MTVKSVSFDSCLSVIIFIHTHLGSEYGKHPTTLPRATTEFCIRIGIDDGTFTNILENKYRFKAWLSNNNLNQLPVPSGRENRTRSRHRVIVAVLCNRKLAAIAHQLHSEARDLQYKI